MILNYRLVLVIGLLLIGSASPCQAQVSLAGPKAAPHVESENDKRFSALDTILQKAIDSGSVVGCNALVFQDGKILYYNQRGQQLGRCCRDSLLGEPKEKSGHPVHGTSQPLRESQLG